MGVKRHLKLRKTKKGKSMRGGSACAAAKESNKVMTGGFAKPAKANAMTGGSACAAAKESNKVMTGGFAKPAKANAYDRWLCLCCRQRVKQSYDWWLCLCCR